MPVPHSHRARGWRYTLLLIALLSSWIPLRAQYFPVQGSLQIRRPYSLYLNDYALPSREAIVITLTNRDIQHPALQVRLRLRIKNTACLIQTREESYFAPIDLQVNFPVRLTSADLQEYFTPQNLGGYGLRGDKLPDGYTEFAVQVVDVFTGAPLSDWISTTLFLESLKPPELLLPQHEEKIEYRMPQQILFQWYPRHQAMSRTTYEFVLKELPDNGAPAPAAFPYGNEIYRTECVTPSLLFSGDEALLVPNQRYAWQVRAIIHDGLDQLGIFENDGRSEVYAFTLTENCPAPLYLKSTLGYARADLSWRIEPRARGYVVAYRPKSAKEDYFEWKTETCDNTHYSLRGLRLGWTYEWRVGSLCSGETPVYSSIAEFTLSSQNEQLLANCGKKPPEGKELSNTPKLDLAVGDQVIIGGDFPMRITALENLGDGWYAGQGITELRAIISVSNIALRFERLRVNTEGYQIDGTVESVYDKGQTNIANADQIDDGGKNLRNVELRIRKQHLDFPLPTNPVVHYNPETQQLEIEDEAGKVHNVPLSLPQNESYQSIFPFVITDANGNRYSLTPEDENRSEEGREGKQQPAGKQRLIVQRLEHVGLFNGNKLKTEKGTIRFTRGKGLYAFDDGVTATKYFLRGSTKLDSYYTPLEKSYTVPWKLVPVGTSDVVEALWDGKKQHKEINPKRVKFVQVTGETLPTLYDSVQKSWRITLPSVQANESYELFALLDGELVGKLRVASYPRQAHRVTLVTLENGKEAEKSKSQQAIDLAELQRALDAIYAPVGVQIELTEQRLLLPQGARWDLDGDGLLSLEGTNFLGQTKDVKESAEMLALQRLFKQHGQYDANGTYLFVLPAGKSGEKGGNILGDMPRGSRFGYLFTGEGKLSTGAFARQIAHELGHGLFTLQHSFDAEYGDKRSLGKTDNLMDYTEAGNELLAFQWNIMSSPALLTAFDKAEEGRLVEEVNTIDAIEQFLTPDLRIVSKIEANGARVILYPQKNNPYVVAFGVSDRKFTWSSTSGTYVDPSGITIEEIPDIILQYNTSEITQRVNVIKSTNDCFCTTSLIKNYKQGEPLVSLDGEESSYWYRHLSDSCKIEFIKQYIRSGTPCTQEKAKKVATVFAQIDKNNCLGVDTLVEFVSTICIEVLQSLEYEHLISFIRKIAFNSSLREESELAILRLVSAISTKDYPRFYHDLEAENSKLLTLLLDGMDDAIIPFKDRNNYTNFIGALCWMFQNAPQSWFSQLTSSEIEQLQQRVFNLNVLRYVFTLDHSRDTIFTCPHIYRGEYNKETGKVTIFYMEHEVLYSEHAAISFWKPHEILSVSPCTPIIITLSQKELPLITTALGGAIEESEFFIVPAIFLEYYKDKENNEDIKNSIITLLDAVTIAASSGIAFAAKVHWVRRLWALAEVAAAAGNIAVNNTSLGDNQEVKKYIEAYNLVIGIIGLYRTAEGVYRVKNSSELLARAEIQTKFWSQYAKYRRCLTELQTSPTFKNAPNAFKTSLKKEAEFVENLRNELLKNGEYKYRESLPTASPHINAPITLDDLVKPPYNVSRNSLDDIQRRGASKWLEESLNSSVHGKEFRSAIRSDSDLNDIMTLEKDKGNIHDLVKEHSIDEDGIKDKGKFDALAGTSNFKEPCRVGRELEDNVVDAIQDKASVFFQKLKKILGISDLELYKVERHVHVFVDEKKQQYMVTDLILYKMVENKIEKMIIIEIKLKSSTEYTVGQKATFTNLLKEIKAAESTPRDPKVLVNVFIRGKKKRSLFNISHDKLALKQVKLYRISGDGTSSPDNVTIEEIKHITQ